MERRTNERTNEQTEKRNNYIPPHTSYVGGITKCLGMAFAKNQQANGTLPSFFERKPWENIELQ